MPKVVEPVEGFRWTKSAIPEKQACLVRDYLKKHICYYREERRGYLTPRLMCIMGNEGVDIQDYSSAAHLVGPWDKLVKTLRDKYAPWSNSAAVNHYRDGRDYISWHSDREVHGDGRITGLVFGVTRRFLLRKADDHSDKFEIAPKNGDMYEIFGTFNKEWNHCVPKQLRVVDPRISITFRKLAIGPSRDIPPPSDEQNVVGVSGVSIHRNKFPNGKQKALLHWIKGKIVFTIPEGRHRGMTKFKKKEKTDWPSVIRDLSDKLLGQESSNVTIHNYRGSSNDRCGWSLLKSDTRILFLGATRKVVIGKEKNKEVWLNGGDVLVVRDVSDLHYMIPKVNRYEDDDSPLVTVTIL